MDGKISRMELQDFKSYCGRAVVGPFNDFTSIVGPNGAGKSNLMDALCMALSTRNTTVRGVALNQFINRQSKAKECVVTVVLKHRHSSKATQVVETCFSRRVDAQDRSTFQINGKTVTAKAYFDHLSKYNISSRVRNFIVFQHEVESVTRKTPKEITKLLEDVSGSAELQSEYEAKKHAFQAANDALAKASAEKRGAAMEANQMRLVQKDADRFTQLQKEVGQERLNLAMAELFYVENALVHQKAQLANFHDSLDKLQKSIPNESHIRDMKAQFVNQHKSYTAELKNSRSYSDELRAKLSLMERAKASIEHMSRQQGEQKRELELLTAETTARSTEMKRLETQKERYETLLRELDSETERDSAAAQEVLGMLKKDDLEAYRQLQTEVECQTVTKRQQKEALEKQRTAAEAAAEQCQAAHEHLQLRRREIADTFVHLDNERKELEHRQKDLLNHVKSLESQIKASQRAQMDIKKRHSEREADLYKIQEQLKELRHMKDTDKQNARNIEMMETLKSLYSVKGRVVDACSIPNKAYRNAVTVALGKNLDALIVDTTETAIRCVTYLKEQRLASKTFLPLDSVTGKEATDRLRTFGGTCKPLVDVIRYDPEIEPVIRFALGETLVCDTIAEAKKVAYGSSSGERFKVVTLDGTVLMKNGTVQGGLASIESRARKWDDRRYEELRATRDRLLNEALRGGEAEMARGQVELRDMASRLDFTRERLKVVEAERSTIEGKAGRAAQDEAKLQEEEKTLRTRIAQYQTEKDNLAAEIKKLNQEIELVETTVFADLQKRVDIRTLREAEKKVKELSQQHGHRRQQLVLVIHKLQTAMKMEEQRIGGRSLREAQNAYDRREEEISRAKQNVMALEKETQQLAQKNGESRKKLVGFRELLDKLQNSIRDVTQTSEKELHRLTLARKGGAALEAACESLRQRRLTVLRRCQMDGLEIPLKPVSGAGTKRQRDAKSQGRTQADVLSQSEPFTLTSEGGSPLESESPATDGAGTTYVDFSNLSEAVRHAAESRERLIAFQTRTQSLVEKLTLELESLGPQIKAAARFSSLESRLDRSSAQFEEAREQVRQANAEFMEVRQRRTARFMEVYEKMASNVDRIYKGLTIGTRSRGAAGSAYLSLEDTEEPYLGGTAYHATPPLKRFMPMEMLSGGERTMAALAFLFSIHALSPSPFFILDEVDAALDAGNVEKLARYIRQNAQQCQFIVVSHKDQLYCLADILLGVTNEKKDASQILSLDLRGYTF